MKKGHLNKRARRLTALCFLLGAAMLTVLLFSACAQQQAAQVYSLPKTVTVTGMDGTTEVYTFSYRGNTVTVEKDGETLLAETCDSAGNLTKRVTYELGEKRLTQTYGYGSAGNVESWTRDDRYEGYSKGKNTYDGAGRLLEEDSRGRFGALNWKTVYEYDPNGRKIAETHYNGAEEAASRRTYAYDGTLGVLTESCTYTGSGTLQQRTVYAYDQAGRRTRREEYDSDGRMQYAYTYEYDTNGRITKVAKQYDETTPGASVATVYGEDGKSRTESFYTAENVLQKVLEYGAEGQLLACTSCDEDGKPRRSESYTYNADGLLTGFVGKNGGAVVQSISITESCSRTLTEAEYRFFMEVCAQVAFPHAGGGFTENGIRHP